MAGIDQNCRSYQQRNTLDNRRENLRVVGLTENNHNHRMNKNNTSGRKGKIKFRSGAKHGTRSHGLGCIKSKWKRI